MNIFGKHEHVTKDELDAHQIGNAQQIESLNAVCVDTREMVRALKDMLHDRMDAIEHRLDCVEQDVRWLKDDRCK